MRQVKDMDDLYDLVRRRKSICYGEYLRHTPARCFVNMQAIFVYETILMGRVFEYEPKEKKPDGRLHKTKS